ncbi:vitamin B12-dependent methionine synthase [Obelidium mucronatum]|nr:vitamin B12-dependent methionine synthase [Obelidium mucronatum]
MAMLLNPLPDPTDSKSTAVPTQYSQANDYLDSVELIRQYSDGKLLLSQFLRRVSKKQKTVYPSGAVVVLATVFGDCYDMGKGIIKAALEASGCEVKDLGVSVPCHELVDAVVAAKADIVGLSGLIIPSLNQMVLVVKEMEKRGLKIPVLVGGAATTKRNTAVEIAPYYSGPVIHAMDASRAIHVLTLLMNPQIRETYLLEARQEQHELLQDMLHSIECFSSSPLSIQEARHRKFQINWNEWKPRVPLFLGSKRYGKIPLGSLVQNIHWDPFFQIMHLRGTYPNHAYPNILKDDKVGTEAKQVLRDVKLVLQEIIDGNLLEARGVVWFGRANSCGDDVRIYRNNESPDIVGTFYGLRQQVLHDINNDHDQACFCISDFIAPAESMISDYIGGMVVSAGFGLKELCDRVQGDDYKVLMYKAAAECLTGALAELVHDQVKHVFWGYRKEDMTEIEMDDALSIDFGMEYAKEGRNCVGIRLAPCFPQQPDHTEMETMWKLMDVEIHTGIKLTETLGMSPVMAVNGLLFSHPKSQCFAVGNVMEDQIQDYSHRRGVPVENVRKWLCLNR